MNLDLISMYAFAFFVGVLVGFFVRGLFSKD